jgi:hypothetical protein
VTSRFLGPYIHFLTLSFDSYSQNFNPETNLKMATRELISSAEFPPKPHNSKWSNQTPVLVADTSAPAVKVPGLVFCAGQTATGEIKQATVSPLSMACMNLLIADTMFDEFGEGIEASWIFIGAGRQVQW